MKDSDFANIRQQVTINQEVILKMQFGELRQNSCDNSYNNSYNNA